MFWIDGGGDGGTVEDIYLEHISRGSLQSAPSLEHSNEMLISAPWLANQKLRTIRII
jgi:hypothetical protein